MHKIAQGDREILSKLSHLEGYKELAPTEDVKEFGRLQDKGERYDHDIMERYLMMKNRRYSIDKVKKRAIIINKCRKVYRKTTKERNI